MIGVTYLFASDAGPIAYKETVLFVPRTGETIAFLEADGSSWAGVVVRVVHFHVQGDACPVIELHCERIAGADAPEPSSRSANITVGG